MNPVNLDAGAGLPLHPAGRAALITALDLGWADPRRRYHQARLARQLGDAARESVAACLGTRAAAIRFTASGSEALWLAMAGLARGRARIGTGVVVSAVEHSAVMAAADELAGEPTVVPVDARALVDPGAFAATVASAGVALAAVQQVNPEVGSVQPLADLHESARTAGVPLVVDACAGIGMLGPPKDWDVLVASAHKWGGPAGVGVLAVAPGVPWRAPRAVDREPGFTNVPALVAAAAALEAVGASRARDRAHVQALVEDLREGIGALPDVILLGPDEPTRRAPHLLSLSVLYADGELLVDGLDRAGFAVASGSACTSDTRRPSHVLAAMGAMTHGNLRLSLPAEATAQQVRDFLAVLPGVIDRAREGAGWPG